MATKQEVGGRILNESRLLRKQKVWKINSYKEG